MATKPATYRVDLALRIGGYCAYSSAKGTDRAMAQSLADSLKRIKESGRIVELPSGLIIEQF